MNHNRKTPRMTAEDDLMTGARTMYECDPEWYHPEYPSWNDAPEGFRTDFCSHFAAGLAAISANISRPALKPAVIVHFDHAGDINYFVPDDAMLLIVDERSPDDRVYLYGSNSTKEEIRELIGDSHIGHSGDGYLSKNQVDAIRASLWLNDGGKLRIVDGEDGV